MNKVFILGNNIYRRAGRTTFEIDGDCLKEIKNLCGLRIVAIRYSVWFVFVLFVRVCLSYRTLVT